MNFVHRPFEGWWENFLGFGENEIKLESISSMTTIKMPTFDFRKEEEIDLDNLFKTDDVLYTLAVHANPILVRRAEISRDPQFKTPERWRWI
jgi:hypothetical protein